MRSQIEKSKHEIRGDWFTLKQALKEWMEKDIEEECKARYIPNKTRLEDEYSIIITEMVMDIIINPVEKERGKKSNSEYIKLKMEMHKWFTKSYKKESMDRKMPYSANLTNEIRETVKKMVVKTLDYLKYTSNNIIFCSHGNIERYKSNANKK